MVAITTQKNLGYSSPGNPGSSTESAWKKLNLVKATGLKVVKTLWVHKSVVVQVNALCLYLQANGARLGQNVDDWGFANRDIRGFPGSKSYHSWGLAIDLDATENPMGIRKTSFAKTEKDKNEVREVCKLLGFRWGLDYTGRPDAMHFESIVSRTRAAYIKSRLVKPTKRAKKLAKLCEMNVKEFCIRVKSSEPYPR